jgi:hypothetical protein
MNMITRRSFLVGAGSTLTLSTVDKFIWHIDNKGNPLIETPKGRSKVLYVSKGDDFRIDLGRAPDKYPTATWRKFLVNKLGHENPTSLSQFREIYHNYGIRPCDLNTECECYFEYWDRTESPTALAYNLLDELNIGPILAGPSNSIGGLVFMDAPAPGHDYLGVHANDDLSVSLLQHRLNELGTGITVELET